MLAALSSSAWAQSPSPTQTGTATGTPTATPTATAIPVGICPGNVPELTPSATSFWPLNEVAGTVITDFNGSNNGAISGNYVLKGQGIQFNTSNGGAQISTAAAQANPQPMSIVACFAGTSGGIAQLANQSSTSAALTYYELFLDTYGHLTFGVNNYGATQVIQSPLTYADGNQHAVLASVGSGGMQLWVDGKMVATRNVVQSNYSSGYWLFGNFNPAGWQYAPSIPAFAGTLYYLGWWNGTQLNSATSQNATGPLPPPINIPLATLTGQIASLSSQFGFAYATQRVVFKWPAFQQTGNGTLIAAGEQIAFTDSQGNLTCSQIPQGAHVNMYVGDSPPIPLIVPYQTVVSLNAVVLAEVDPPDVVSAIDVLGGLFAGCTVINPPVGMIGTATIICPASQPFTTSGPITLDLSKGNVQSVTLFANSAITLTNWQDGQQFTVDVIQNSTGGYSPTFVAGTNLSGNAGSLVWSGGGGQPSSATAPNTYSEWSFTVLGSIIQGVLLQSPTGGNTFNTLNVTSGINDTGQITVGCITPVNPTVTVHGTAGVTSYGYALVCNDGNSGVTPPSSFVSVSTGNAVLSASNYNTITAPAETGCATWTVLKTNSTIELGVISAPSGSLNDSGQATSAYSGPVLAGQLYNTTCQIQAQYLDGNLTTLTTVGDTLYENSSGLNARLSGSLIQLATPSAPTVTTFGATGATSYSYYLVCNDRFGGKTTPSLAGTIGTGYATLSVSNYNIVNIPSELGCVTWDILSPDTGHSVALAQTGPTFNDVGAGSTAYSTPTTNTTAAGTYLQSVPNASNTPTAPSWQRPPASDIAGFDNVTVTGIPATNYLPFATGPNAAKWQNPTLFSSLLVHGSQAFGGTGTFTVPAGVYSLIVRCWGGGGGGGGYGAAAANGTGGGNTTVIGGAGDVCEASGGSGGVGATSGVALGGAGGINGGGSNILEIEGGNGFSAQTPAGASGTSGGGVGGTAANSTGNGMGAGGAGGGTGVGTAGGGGGGGSGFGEAVVPTTPGATFAVSIGAGGAAGTGGTQNATVGQDGAVLFIW